MAGMKRVTLFKHGVGFFERELTVEGDSVCRLSFKASEMNDVLKTLTVNDLGGGRVRSISYDNQKPPEQLLADVSLDLPNGGGGLRLLGAVRGAEVLVQQESRTVRGLVVGVDEYRSKGELDTYILSVFDDDGHLHNLDLRTISDLKFVDEEIQKEMRYLFLTMLSTKKKNSRELRLFCQGENRRTLEVSYMVECPVWKTSYRVEVLESGALHLQGWAVVDNPQEEDWEDVQLSLACGLPISFRHDLYTPRYVERTEVAAQGVKPAAPVTTASTEDNRRAMVMACCSMAPRNDSGSRLAGQTVVSESAPQKTGEMFEYRIEKPVTVLRNQSALVPILQEQMDGGKVLFYRESDRKDNPFFAFELHNRDDLTLEEGPVNVYEEGMYAGEAMLSNVGPGEELIVCYAVALEIEVSTRRRRMERFLSHTLKEGVYASERADYLEIQYTFHNPRPREHTLVVECPKERKHLVSGSSPMSETARGWRFRMTLPAQSTHTLRLVLRDVESEEVLLERCDIAGGFRLLERFEPGQLDPRIKAVLETLSDLRTRKVALDHKSNDLRVKRDEMVRDQQRIRENLKSLGSSEGEATLRGEYARRLRDDETVFAQIEEELLEAKNTVESLNKEFRSKVCELSLDWVDESPKGEFDGQSA